jgi:hypothetical protein
VRQGGRKSGQRKVAKVAGVSLSEVSAVLLGKHQSSLATVPLLYSGQCPVWREAHDQAEHVREVLEVVRDRRQRTWTRQFARHVKEGEANPAHVLSDRCKASQMMLARLQAALAQDT